LSQASFSSLQLHPDLLKNLDSLGYQAMTPIQERSLPHILAGADLVAQSRTGSGKTAAFGLGLLARLEVKRFRIQSLVLCPTRELADQVAKELRRLGRSIHNIKVLTLSGGTPFGPQRGSLEHGAHIIVGTPGRIEDHLGKGTLRLDDVNMLVLDEADRMLEMGFQSALEAIFERLPRRRQTLLFSATFPEAIQAIADRILVDPVKVQVDADHDQQSIRQHFYRVESDGRRLNALHRLLLEHRPDSTVVFCNTKRETQEVAERLLDFGFSALALHGDLEQRERDETLARFAGKSVSILVATDVASRGLDIDALDAVINYHLAHDSEVHVHRVGRTGRAGSQGFACSLYSDQELHKLASLEARHDRAIEGEPLPPEGVLDRLPMRPPMATLRIDGGKRQKVRPGDILGALTGENGIAGKAVGKIQSADNWTYVAVSRDAVKAALRKLGQGKIKGRLFRVHLL